MSASRTSRQRCSRLRRSGRVTGNAQLAAMCEGRTWTPAPTTTSSSSSSKATGSSSSRSKPSTSSTRTASKPAAGASSRGAPSSEGAVAGRDASCRDTLAIVRATPLADDDGWDEAWGDETDTKPARGSRAGGYGSNDSSRSGTPPVRSPSVRGRDTACVGYSFVLRSFAVARRTGRAWLRPRLGRGAPRRAAATSPTLKRRAARTPTAPRT